MSLFEELKRRNVIRVGMAYAVASWLLLQLTDILVPILDLSDSAAKFVFLLLVVGFIPALIIAWAFELTPDGVKLEKDVDRSQSVTTGTGRKLDFAIIGILAIAVILLLVDRFTGSDPDVESGLEPAQAQTDTPIDEANSASASPSHEKSIAVLPFVNMSDDAENEYFSDGISEELLNVLVRIEGLRVPSRTSSFTFKGSNKKISEIGKELNVDTILEGSVRRADDRIRVTAQLIDVHTDTHLWSDTYTRKVDDIFAVQDEIAQAIVAALKVTLSGTEKASLSQHSTENIEAYNKFLLGRHLWNQRTAESMVKSVEHLKLAVEIDPGFDRAWAALADTYALIPEFFAGSIEENIPLGREAAERALEINPESARALNAQAYLKAMYEYDIEGANADFELAIALEPSYATAHQWYAEILAAQRRLDESLAQIDLAIAADPLSAAVSHVKGWILIHAGRYEEALDQWKRALELDPSMPNIFANQVRAFTALGQFEQGRLALNVLSRLRSGDLDTRLAIIDAQENPALTDRAVEAIQQSELINDGVFGRAFSFAELKQYELALQNLEKAFEQGDPYAIHMNRMNLYEPLREDPRFQAMLKEMNLWP